jgi:oligopeptide transport system permease protein
VFNLILKRFLMAIPVLLIVASITFFLVRLAPGGPFDSEKVVSPQVLKNLNEVYNLKCSLD